MKVIVRYHETAKADLKSWFRLLPGPRNYKREFAREILDALLILIAFHEGVLHGADRELSVEPPTW